MTGAPITAPDQLGDLGLRDAAIIGTGASRPIRAATAARIGAAEASVTLVGRRKEPLVDAPVHQTWADDLEAAYRWLAEQVPPDRIGVADEVARRITFLLSPLSSFITGAVVPLDRGQVIHRA